MQATPEKLGAAASTRAPQNTTATPRRRTGERWLFSLTAICFLFGGLMALQMRAIQNAEKTRLADVKDEAELERKRVQDRLAAEREQRELKAELATLKSKFKAGTTISEKNAKLFSGQIKSLEMVSGLTAVAGPGVRVDVRDNPTVAGGDISNFAPGLVHDFDLLQIVNELRAASAEAISVNGMRITAYTPIRCVGPVIHINWQPAASPFVIEAIGDPGTLESALLMPGGILANLKDESRGPALPIKVTRVSDLSLPAASGGAPRLKAARPQLAAAP